MKTIRINLMSLILVVFILVSTCTYFFRTKNDMQTIKTSQLDTFFATKEIQATVKYNVVNDFNANGSDQSSDTKAFQNALNMAKGNNKIIEIVVPKGTYIIDSTLSIFSNTIITLDDEAILKSWNGGEFLVSRHLNSNGEVCPKNKECEHYGYTQIRNILIQGGTWDCNGISTKNYSGITIAHGQNIIIKNTCLKNTAGHAINVSDSCDILIDNVTIENQISSVPAKADDTNEVIHLDYAGSGEYGSTWGSYPIDGTPVKNVVIQNCTFSNVLCGIGSHTTASEESSMGDNILIQNNNFSNIKCYGMNLFAHKNVKIINNTATGKNTLNLISNKNEAYAFVRGEYLKAEIRNNKVSNFETTIVKNDKNNTFFSVQTDDNNIKNRFFIFNYMPNGGIGNMNPSIVEYGVSTRISKNLFTRTGYKFNGWNIYRTYPGSSVSQRWYCGSNIGWKTDKEILDNGYTKAIYKDQVAVQGTSPWHHSVVELYATWVKMNKIEITKLPTKLNYKQNNENIDLTGGELTVYYEDNTTETIDLTKANITGFNNSIVGEQTINVEYENLKTSFKITVEVDITNIDKVAPQVQVSYNTQEKTNGNVVVTITANKEIQEVEGWTLSQDRKTLSKTYTQNANEDVVIKDLAGNEDTINVNVSNIEKIEPFLKGDVNKNGEIDISDILQLERHIAYSNSKDTALKHSEWKLNNDKLKIGDINENGIIDITDVLKLLRYIAANSSSETAQKHANWINL